MLFGRHVNRYYIKYGLYFLLGIAALIAVDIFQLKTPELIRSIIDGIEQSTITRTELVGYMKQFFIIVLVMFAGRFLWRICIFGNGVRIETDIREAMFKHTERLSQEYYQVNKTGALMSLYITDLQAIRQSFGQGMVMFIDVLFLGVLAFYKMLKIDLLLTILSCIPLVLMAICAGVIGRYIRKKFELRQKAYADLSDFAQESFSGIAVIKAFVKEGKELLAFSKINKDTMDKNIEFVKAATLLRIIIGLLISSVVIVIIGYGGYLVYSDAILGGKVFTIGRLTEYLSYFSSLTWPMMAISQLINLNSQSKASLKRVNQLLDQKPDIVDKDVINVDSIEGKIEFNHLNFKYPGTDKLVLEDITFTINKGESIGIIGRTGSGKTTLVDLLLRIYNLEDKQIYIDDKDIMHLPFKKVRDGIAYVPQDNFLFSDTINNNINFYNRNSDLVKTRFAASLADVDTNISDFKEGYDTILGERGVTVSGGQKQRISIARALIKDAPILILDDSVSAVDTKTEETILNNLNTYRKDKTTILIAHRFSTVKNMDKIVILDDGKLAGFGTHEELLKNNTLYQNMVRLQTLEDEVGGN